MKPAAATLGELVSAGVGGDASKSQIGALPIVLGEEVSSVDEETGPFPMMYSRRTGPVCPCTL